jgi:hypothetical protein
MRRKRRGMRSEIVSILTQEQSELSPDMLNTIVPISASINRDPRYTIQLLVKHVDDLKLRVHVYGILLVFGLPSSTSLARGVEITTFATTEF